MEQEYSESEGKKRFMGMRALVFVNGLGDGLYYKNIYNANNGPHIQKKKTGTRGNVGVKMTYFGCVMCMLVLLYIILYFVLIIIELKKKLITF